MEAKDLFTLALQLSPEWKVVECQLGQVAHRLTLKLDSVPGSRFPAPGASHPLLLAVHDTREKTWCHLDFFQYQTELVARVPRVKTPEGEVRVVAVPWARPGSGFTFMMEAWTMLLCSAVPVKEADKLLKESDTRLWRLVAHYGEAAQARRDWSKVRRVMVDVPKRSGDRLPQAARRANAARQTSACKGHRYVTSVVDADTRELRFMTEGRQGDTLARFVEKLRARADRTRFHGHESSVCQGSARAPAQSAHCLRSFSPHADGRQGSRRRAQGTARERNWPERSGRCAATCGPTPPSRARCGQTWASST